MPKFLDVTDKAAARAYLGLQHFDVTTYGATGNGTTDDTSAIHAARDAAGVGGTVVVPPGIYITTGLTLNLASQMWQIMPGAIIKTKSQAYSSRHRTILVSAENVTITGGGTVDGNRAAIGDNAANVPAAVSGDVNSNYLTIDNITVQNSTYYGVWAQGSGTRVLRCTFTGNYAIDIILSSYYLAVQHGSTMQDTYDMEASYNFIDRSDILAADANWAAIKFAGNSGSGDPGDDAHTTYRPKALGNTILLTENPDEPTGRVQGIEMAKAEHGLVQGNRVVNGAMGCSFAENNYGQSIGNTFIGSVLFGQEISFSQNCIVQGNSIDGNSIGGSKSSGSGININSASNNTVITGNHIFNMAATCRPISAGASIGVAVTGNSIESSYGITFTGASDSTISSNTFTGDTVAGAIGLINCNGIAVTGNTMQDYVYGVQITATSGTSDYINVTGNHFHTCTTPFDGVTAGGTLGTNMINANNTVRA